MAIGNLWQHRRNTAMAVDYWYKAANSNEHDIRMAALDSLLKIKPDNTFLLQEYHRATKESPSINTDEIARLQSDFEQNALQKRAYQRISVLLLVIILLMVAAFVGRRYYINKVKRLYRNLNNVNARYVHDLEAYRWAKNEISRLEKRIADYQDDRKAPEKWNIENEMLATDCVITLHRLASRGRQAPENSRQELYQLVANHDPSLMKTLHQSHLNEKERLVCLLIRLRFIPSELSVLLGISPQNVTNMRQRLLQKLFHAQGGAKDFDERIRSL
jgi:putative tetratricopeptide repeat-containing domain protein